MKKLTIGRNNACDIIIPDTSDLVSRKQAILSYSFWGKMVIYDTSNNGTYVNGQKLENGKGMPVTRKDKVTFARIADLDWNEIKDPYRKVKIIIAASMTVVVLLAVLLTFWLTRPIEDEVPNIPSSEVKGPTESTIQPKVVEEAPVLQPKKHVRKKPRKSKGQILSPKEMRNKEVNDNSPIIY